MTNIQLLLIHYKQAYKNFQIIYFFKSLHYKMNMMYIMNRKTTIATKRKVKQMT